MKYGSGFVTGVSIQWQEGKQVTIWPPNAATGKVVGSPFASK
jgi:branched-chain amino acid transport system substrate-binding protein